MKCRSERSHRVTRYRLGDPHSMDESDHRQFQRQDGPGYRRRRFDRLRAKRQLRLLPGIHRSDPDNGGDSMHNLGRLELEERHPGFEHPG